MARLRTIFLPVGLVLILAVGFACSPGEPQLCCNEGKGDFSSDIRSYCLDHAVAAGLFIQEPEELAERQQRHDDFTLFYRQVTSCTTLDCIATALDTTTLVPGFKTVYDREHAKSERDLEVDAGDKPKLILCGFEHAVAAGVE